LKHKLNLYVKKHNTLNQLHDRIIISHGNQSHHRPYTIYTTIVVVYIVLLAVHEFVHSILNATEPFFFVF
jgi:hypothetical protein